MDAKTIKHAREAQGHTVTEAAASVGVSSRTWRNWEKDGANSQSPAIIRSLFHYVKQSRNGGK